MRWSWIIFEVLMPIFAPILISFLVVLLWWSGQSDFHMKPEIVLDVSPWALTFYGITLIGSTMNKVWPELSSHPGRGVGLILFAITITFYAGLMVIWRHDPNFVPTVSVYVVTLGILIGTIYVCYWCAKI